MSDIITSLVHEHEIVKAEDFTFAFQSIIKNTALLDRMLSAAETDYIKGGRVTAAGGFNVRIEPIWGNGRSQEVPLFCDQASELIPVAPAPEFPRIDTVQVKGVMEDWDIKRRAFYNPELENGQYFMVPTKSRVSVACQIKKGVDESVSAPDADEGWIKIAEIAVEPETAEIEQSDIHGVTAIYQHEENASWTNQKARTFNLGGLNEIRQMFGFEHNLDGSHRTEVIKTANIATSAVTTAKLADANVTTGKIKDGAVTTDKIADTNVTTAKLADSAVTTAKINAAAVETAKIKDGNVTTDKINALAVTEAKIADGAVTTAKIKDANVTSGKIATSAVITDKINALAVTEAKIAALAVTSGKIAASAVITDKINALAVTEAKIADGAVTTAKIKDANVTTAKLADANVTTAKLADGAVTAAKIAAGAGGIPPDETTIIKNTDGKLQVKDSGIGTAKIADGSITQAKLAAGVGGSSPDNITISETTGGKLQVKDGGVSTDKLAASAVTAAKLAYTLDLSATSYTVSVKTASVPTS
jgi:uncharacterized protein YjbI with pentapeptide repeats